MSRAITIVGASARAAAFSAARAGFSVRAADVFADVDLRQVADAVQVEDYPAGLGLVLAGPSSGPWMYTGAVENYPELVASWQQQRPLWGNSAEVLTRVRSPQAVAAALRAAGLPAPDVSLSPDGLPRNDSWLCKSLRSAGGMRVAAWNGRRAASCWQGCYFQQFIPGTACAAVYVAAAGSAALLGITRQLIGERWTGASEFNYCGSWGPWPCTSEVSDAFRKIGNVLASTFGLIGLLGVDAVVNDDGVWAIEVNPRYTASIEVLERSCRFRAIDLHAAACLGGRLPQDSSTVDVVSSGKVVLYSSKALCIPTDSDAAWLQPGRSTWPAWADIPAPGTAIAAGMPLVTALNSARDEHTLQQLLRTQAAQVWHDLESPAFDTGVR